MDRSCNAAVGVGAEAERWAARIVGTDMRTAAVAKRGNKLAAKHSSDSCAWPFILHVLFPPEAPPPAPPSPFDEH